MNMQPQIQVPENVALEQQVLGAVLLNNELYHKIGGLVRAAHFYEPTHADIWRNIAGRIERDHIASPVTLKADLEQHEGLIELGGPAYLVRLAGASISGSMVADYARELVEVAERRRIAGSIEDARKSLLCGGSAEDGIAALEMIVSDAVESGSAPRSKSLLRASTLMIKQLNEAYQSGTAGVSTGLSDLDELIGGLVPGEVTIVAGSTSMGKTTFGTWLAYVAANAGYGVGFASLEMSEEALTQRVNSIDSQVPYQAMRNGKLSETLFRKVFDTVKEQQALPIQIYSERVRDIPAILSETKRLQKRWIPQGEFKGLGVLVIDYIQLVRGRGQNKFDVLGQVAEDTKALAKLLHIPVVALAQIARDMSKRDSKVPHLGDLRGSGDLENAADNVIFCHRPDYFLEREEPEKDPEKRAMQVAAQEACKGTMDLIVGKQRMGPLGTIRVGCDLATNRFWDITNQEDMSF